MDWSIFTTVVVHGGVQGFCCKQVQVCRNNLGGDEKGGVSGKFIGM